MITRRDVAISLVISIGSFVISIGIMGIKNLLISTMFFIVPLVLTLILFFIFKPKTPPTFPDKKWDY